MALTGQQHINIGNVNEQTGSDSLYDAFTKVENNFNELFTNASPYKQFISDGTTAGIEVIADEDTGKVVIKNTGVADIIGSDSIEAFKKTNGDVVLSVKTNAVGIVQAGVTGIGLASSTLELSENPYVISSGTIDVNLQKVDVAAGVYDRPKINVDEYGRVVAIEQSDAEGIVTSVAIQGGTGISVAGSPITSNGTIRINNTGVTKIVAGSGIRIDSASGTGNVTISATLPTTTQGTVKKVTLVSNTLVVDNTQSVVTTTGNLKIDLPTSYQYAGGVSTITPQVQSAAPTVNNAIVIVPQDATPDYSIKLPVATPGTIIRVLWPHQTPATATFIRVYPAVGARIDFLEPNINYRLSRGKKVEFIATSTTQWHTFVSA